MRWWISNGILWTDTLGPVQDPQPPKRPGLYTRDVGEWLQKVEEGRSPSETVRKARRKIFGNMTEVE
jgi:hypothetical protein